MNATEFEKVSKMTKSEIIEYFKHLSDTVEAKDKEINDLKSSHRKEVLTLQGQAGSARESIKLEVRRELEQEYAPLKEELGTVKASYQNFDEKEKWYKQQLERRGKELQKMINLHGALLKQLQGMVDTALEVNEYFVKEATQ
jgi:DNA repair exonuclease SbcCD ATPase subunit